MIILPNASMVATPTVIDNGFFQRGALGGSTSRFNRKGNRYKLSVSAGPFYPDIGRQWVADLIAGKQEGVRMLFPLQWPQGSPGAPLVAGAQTGGTSLTLDGLTPNYVAKKGYFLTLINAAGRRYLHSVKTTSKANDAGAITITLNEEMRHPFADNAVCLLSKPEIEGLIDGNEWSWDFNANQVIPISFTLEEYE